MPYGSRRCLRTEPQERHPRRRRGACCSVGAIAAAILLSTKSSGSPPSSSACSRCSSWGSDFLTPGGQAVPHLGLVPGARAGDGAARSGAGRRDRHRLRDRRRDPRPDARHLRCSATWRRTRSSRSCGGDRAAGLPTRHRRRGRCRDRGVRRVHASTNVLNFAMIAGHIVSHARRLAARDVPRRVPAGRPVGAGDRLADRDGGVRLRALRRRRRSACSRSPSASASCCCARC